MTPETKKSFDGILGILSGIDGLTQFLNYKFLIEAMDEKAEKGDESAKKVLAIMHRFYHLLKLVLNEDKKNEQ